MKFIQHFKKLMEKVDLLGTKPENYDKNYLKSGEKVEKEHTTSSDKAKHIAMQHAVEFPKKHGNKITSDYYKKLKPMEKKLEKNTTKSFKDIVDEVVKENTLSGGDSSMFGNNAGNGSTWNGGQSGDTYATGDARNLFGSIQAGKGKKKKKKNKAKVIMPMIRRTFPKTI